MFPRNCDDEEHISDATRPTKTIFRTDDSDVTSNRGSSETTDGHVPVVSENCPIFDSNVSATAVQSDSASERYEFTSCVCKALEKNT